jgi:ATP synthase protein I
MADDDRGRLGRAYSIGFEFAAAVAGCVLFGYAVDWYYGTSPWGILIGAGIGIIGGMYNMIRSALNLAKEQERRRADTTRPDEPT